MPGKENGGKKTGFSPPRNGDSGPGAFSYQPLRVGNNLNGLIGVPGMRGVRIT
jgi:hypothetical protein